MSSYLDKDVNKDLKPVQQRSYTAVLLVMVTFLAVSIITNVMGPIFPALKDNFQISNTITALFPFFFFLAYGVMSIPAGLIGEKLGEKTTMMAAFITAALGSLLLVLMPTLPIALLSLFCIGAAMAFLQVVINPLLRVAGGEEHYAFFSTLAQCTFAAGGMMAPLVYAGFVESLQGSSPSFMAGLLAPLVPDTMPWLAMYWLFIVVAVALLLMLMNVKLPRVHLQEDEQVGGVSLCLSLFKSKTVVLFFFGIAAYVGAEVGITTSMSLFLQQYHGLDPQTQGAQAIAQFWSAMAIGCLVGLMLMKLMDSRHVLLLFAALAMVSYSVALFSPTQWALLGYSACGFFLSVMYPAIFSLGLNSVRHHHGSVAGILCTGIAGGALVPVMVGMVADVSGSYKLGACMVFIPLGYVLGIGLWAKPLVCNKTLNVGEFVKKKLATPRT